MAVPKVNVPDMSTHIADAMENMPPVQYVGPNEEVHIPEPSIEEIVHQATRELEMQVQDLGMKLTNKESEVVLLNEQLKAERQYFDKIVSRLVLTFLGDK